MEDLKNEFQLYLNEIRSCIVILQKALENECDEIEFRDIKNYLEIAKDKCDQVINIYQKIETLLEAKN